MKSQRLSGLKASECQRIHESSLAVLAETGVKVLNERGRRLLSGIKVKQLCNWST